MRLTKKFLNEQQYEIIFPSNTITNNRLQLFDVKNFPECHILPKLETAYLNFQCLGLLWLDDFYALTRL